jgi:hypothetical protein
MTRVARCVLVFVLVTTFAGLATGTAHAQTPISVADLADYRLTAEVFERFVRASARVAEVTRQDTTFAFAPLFTRDVALSDDAVTSAAGLVARLEHHPGLAEALGAATLSAREYSMFAITLVAAHVAQGFVKSGVLRRVPPGAPTVNVEFVTTHESDVVAALAVLGIQD